MYIGLNVRYLLLLLEFNEIAVFLVEIRKILKYQIS